MQRDAAEQPNKKDAQKRGIGLVLAWRRQKPDLKDERWKKEGRRREVGKGEFPTWTGFCRRAVEELLLPGNNQATMVVVVMVVRTTGERA